MSQQTKTVQQLLPSRSALTDEQKERLRRELRRGQIRLLAKRAKAKR